ncbi:MAG: hypothetical protein WC180_02965 [Candidatus Paceibacterota bacterium]
MSQKILRTMQDDLKEVKDTKTGRGFFRKSEPAEKDKSAQKPLPTQVTVSTATGKTKKSAQSIPAETEKGNFTDMKHDLERKSFDVSMSPLPQNKKKDDKSSDFFAKLQNKIAKKKKELQEQPPVQAEPKIEKATQLIEEIKKADPIKKGEEEVEPKKILEKDSDAAKTENDKTEEEVLSQIKKQEEARHLAVQKAAEAVKEQEADTDKGGEENEKENVLSQIKEQEEVRRQEVQKAAEAVKEQEALRQEEMKKAQETLKMQEIKITNILREVSDSMNQEESVAEQSKKEMEEIRVKVLEEAKKNKEDILSQIRRQEEVRRQEVQKAQEELKKQEALRAQEAKMAQQALKEEDAKRAKESERLRTAIASQEAEIANLIKRTANPLNKEELIEEMRSKILEEEKKNKEDLLAQMKAQEAQLADFMRQVSDTLNKNIPKKEELEQDIIAKIKAEEEKTKQDILMQFKAEQAKREEEARKLQDTIQEKDTQIANLVKGISESLQEEFDEGEAKEKLIAEMQTKIATLEEEKIEKENALEQVKEAAKKKAEEEIKREAEQKLAEEEERLKQEKAAEEAAEAERQREEQEKQREKEEQRAIEEEKEKEAAEEERREEEEIQKLRKEEEERIEQEKSAQKAAEEEEERIEQEEAAKKAAEEERLKQEETERLQKEEEEAQAAEEEEEERMKEEAAQKAIEEEKSQTVTATTIPEQEETPETEEIKADTQENQSNQPMDAEIPKEVETDPDETFWNALRQERGIDTEKSEGANIKEIKPSQDTSIKPTTAPQEVQPKEEVKPPEVPLATVHDDDITELIKKVSNSMETPGKNSPEKPQETTKPDKDRDLKDLLSRMSKNLQKEKIALAEKNINPAAKLGPAAADYLDKHPEAAQTNIEPPSDNTKNPKAASAANNYWQNLQSTETESAISPQQRIVGGTNYGTSPYEQPAADALPNDNSLAMPEEVKNAQMRIQDRRKMQSDYANPENRLIYGRQEYYSTTHKAIKPKTRMENLEGLDGVLKEEELELSDEEEKKRLKKNIVSKYGIKLFQFPWMRVIVITIMFLAIIGGSLALILPKLNTPGTKELAPVVVGKSISEIDKKISSTAFAKQGQVTTLNFFDANLDPWKQFNNGDIVRLSLTYDNQDLMLSRSEALKSVLGEDNADNIPDDFMDVTSPEYNILVFKEGGSLRLALVFKFTASEEEELKDIMSSWEKTNTKSKKIYTVMKNLFVNSRIIEQDSLTFQPAIYNGTELKFINLPDSDTSMDYFIYEGYIVFTSSKDHTFQLIDKLKS